MSVVEVLVVDSGGLVNAYMSPLVFFFFQAEDGIRDLIVTGVQTCALPICSRDGCACESIWATSGRVSQLGRSRPRSRYSVLTSVPETEIVGLPAGMRAAS